MKGSRLRVMDAFEHRTPDRTPLFELFQPYHPIHWDICGRNLATDQRFSWDAQADGVALEEIIEDEAQARVKMAEYFGLDMIHVGFSRLYNFERPVKIGEKEWELRGIPYCWSETKLLIEEKNPADRGSRHSRMKEENYLHEIEEWDGKTPDVNDEKLAVLKRVKEIANQKGMDVVFMGEVGSGTGVAFYPPWQLMWFFDKPDLLRKWLKKRTAEALSEMGALINYGCEVVALGGDVSGDKGPFISPKLYHEFILPEIQDQVAFIHSKGAKAVYTADGNHWLIREDFFFNSGIDGYKEIDKAAGMTMERLVPEVKDSVCLIGNIDARFNLCTGTPKTVRDEVLKCLKVCWGNGGHVLHASHSVHEDVKILNYFAAVNAYRDHFGIEKL